MGNANVLSILRNKFGKVKVASKGMYRIPCPTCDPHNSKKMKRYICPGWKFSKCYICDEQLEMGKLLGESLDVFDSLPSPVIGDDDYPLAKTPPYTKLTPLTKLPPDHPVIQFLAADHLTNLSYYDKLGIGYIALGDGGNIKFESEFIVNTSDSLFFPVYHRGEFVGWQCRFIAGTQNGDRFQFMRYFHMFPKGSYLFNYDTAKKYDHVIVVEGAKKALKFSNAVATLGKGITDVQKQLIQEWKSITLLLDSEPSTVELANKIAEECRFNNRQCIAIDLSKYGYDSPDEATAEKLSEIIEEEWKKIETQN